MIRLSREDRDNMFLSLSTLQIYECPIMLGLPFLSYLCDLDVPGKCSQHLLRSIHKLHSFNEKLSCFPEGMVRNLASIKVFDICCISKLEHFSKLMDLNAIQEIHIFG